MVQSLTVAEAHDICQSSRVDYVRYTTGRPYRRTGKYGREFLKPEKICEYGSDTSEHIKLGPICPQTGLQQVDFPAFSDYTNEEARLILDSLHCLTNYGSGETGPKSLTARIVEKQQLDEYQIPYTVFAAAIDILREFSELHPATMPALFSLGFRGNGGIMQLMANSAGYATGKARYLKPDRLDIETFHHHHPRHDGKSFAVICLGKGLAREWWPQVSLAVDLLKADGVNFVTQMEDMQSFNVSTLNIDPFWLRILYDLTVPHVRKARRSVREYDFVLAKYFQSHPWHKCSLPIAMIGQHDNFMDAPAISGRKPYKRKISTT